MKKGTASVRGLEVFQENLWNPRVNIITVCVCVSVCLCVCVCEREKERKESMNSGLGERHLYN